MKKRLLFAFAMLLTATLGFAQYVYTPQGKFKVDEGTTKSILTSDLAGWTVEGEGFAYVGEQNGFKANASSPADGMTYTIASGIDASKSYVVTLTVAQPDPTQTCHRSLQTWLCDHIKADANDCFFSISGVSNDDPENVVECAKPTEIMPGEAKDYSFAIVPDEAGTPRTYTVKLLGWAGDLVVTDIKYQEAEQVGDDRAIRPYLEHAKMLLDLKEWPASDDLDGLNENIEYAESVLADEDTQVEDMEGALDALKEAIAEFQKNQMDDQLSGSADKIPVATTKVQKVNNIGVWTGFSGGAGRIHSSAGGYYDVGHYAGNTKWGFGNGCLGLTTKMTLQPGVYVFSMQQRAVSRLMSTSTCWDENTGLSCAYAVMYVRPVGDEAAEANVIQTDAEYEKSIAVAYSQYNLPADKLEKHTISFTITEAGEYEFAVKTYAQEHYKDMANGGTFVPFDAQIYGKTEAKYNKEQLDYEEDVRGQITAARDNIEKAVEYLGDETQPWGKAELAAVVEEIEPIVVGYEEWTQDEIIATYDKDLYDKEKGLEAINEDYSSEEETVYYRLMASEVYRLAAKIIIAANNDFTSKNDKLASLGAAIAAAENVLTFRINDMADGKDALVAKIAEAKALEAQLRADDYSEENAAAIDEMKEELQAAINALAIPASAITVLADVDFEIAPVPAEGSSFVDEAGNAQNCEAILAGNVGSMFINSFSTTGVNTSCQLGIESNGETILGGVLRLGNAEGTVEVPVQNYGTDIVRVSMDWWFGNLSGKNAGFYLKDENEENIGGLYCNRYNGTTEYDATGIFALGGVIGRGSSTQSNAVICEDGNKTHLEYILDYGTKKAYCVSTLPTKEITTEMVDFTGEAIAKFMIKSNYNNNDRRCWFDNLKIERIKTNGEVAIKGDVNGDGKVDIADLNVVIDVVMGDATANTDVNGDNKVDIADVNAVIDIIMGE